MYGLGKDHNIQQKAFSKHWASRSSTSKADGAMSLLADLFATTQGASTIESATTTRVPLGANDRCLPRRSDCQFFLWSAPLNDVGEPAVLLEAHALLEAETNAPRSPAGLRWRIFLLARGHVCEPANGSVALTIEEVVAHLPGSLSLLQRHLVARVHVREPAGGALTAAILEVVAYFGRHHLRRVSEPTRVLH